MPDQPSSGFFTLAKDLGLTWDDERAFAQEHVQRVWERYGIPQPA